MRLNWTAIVVAAAVDWLLAAVWFTVFRNQWQAGLRMSQTELQVYMAHPNFWPYLIALLCNLVMAYAIARMVAGSQTQGLFRGILAGSLIGLAVAAAIITEMVFEYRPGSFVLIAAAYPLLGCVLMGIIIGVWKSKLRAAEDSPVSGIR